MTYRADTIQDTCPAHDSEHMRMLWEREIQELEAAEREGAYR